MFEFYIWNWLELSVRWFHVVAGIAWVGSSFYFIALDLGLRKNSSHSKGIQGEAWQVHGGGFYHLQKYNVAPPNLPDNLTWFKWESYATWLSGFALLSIVYYGGAEMFLIDVDVLDIDVFTAVSISIVSLMLGWVIYNTTCKFFLSDSQTGLMILLFFILAIVSYGYTEVFSGRAAMLHIGAFTATLMSANVFFIIIPNQRIVVADLKAGKVPDSIYGKVAKQRSTHNNYLTLPVLFLMISIHYPLVYTSEFNWVIALIIFLTGVSIRHFFNSQHAGKGSPYWTWVVTIILIFIAIFLSTYRPEHLKPDLDEVKFNDEYGELINLAGVTEIISYRCTMCHAKEPLWDNMYVPPKGVILETSNDVLKYAKQIYIHAAISNSMPPNNLSAMEPEERLILARWYEEIKK